MSIFGNIFNGSILSLKATHLKTSTTQSHSSADSGMKRCASCSRQRSSASCAELDKAASLQQLSPKRSQPAGQAGGEMCSSLQLVFLSFSKSFVRAKSLNILPQGSHSLRKVQFFLTLFKRPLTPPPLSFEHHVVNFSEGILTKVRKRLSQQLSTK